MPKLIWPLDKVFITQPFGANPQIYEQFHLKGHDGIDLRTRYIDSPLGHRFVMAAAAGVVETVRFDHSGYGTHIRIRHLDGSLTIYGHLFKVLKKVGDKVGAGEDIGITDNTGFSSGPHLHFEYRPANCDVNNGYAGAVDPRPFLPPIPKQ